MIQNRLFEYYQRVVRPDMLNMFDGVVSLRSLDVSMILDSATASQPDTKYKAACFIELLTGRRPSVGPCDVFEEGVGDVLIGGLSGNLYLDATPPGGLVDGAGRQSDKERRSLLLKIRSRTVGMSAPVDYRLVTSSHSGLKINCHLNTQLDAFSFIEKLREFYLPDPTFSKRTAQGSSSLLTHAMNAPRDEMLGSFFVSFPYIPLPEHILLLKSKVRRRTTKSHVSFQSAFSPGENPSSAKTIYVLKAADFLKFPDVEPHFEALSSILSAGGPTANAFHVYIKPHLQVTMGRDILNEKSDGKSRDTVNGASVPDTIKMMTFFLSSMFNPFSVRLRQKLAPPTRAQRLEAMYAKEEREYLESTPIQQKQPLT